MRIGPYELANRLFVAPMAGVTDRPFRQLCRRLGAGHAVGEMVGAKRELWTTGKTLRRTDHAGEAAPVAVQIVGTEPVEMADAARHNVDRGAQIVDINMGCPAKKVCGRAAGSALMRDERRAIAIVEAVVAACAPLGVPVTLKMRTGWSEHERNAVSIARAAESAGVAMLTVHGRTREQGFRGEAEYATIAAVKAAVRVPVVANGDVDSPAKALAVLRATGADALMIGRAAQRRPWLFREVAQVLAGGEPLAPPTTREVRQWLLDHLADHHAFHGAASGTRTARKHLGWTMRALPGAAALLAHINTVEDPELQYAALASYLDELAERHPRWPDQAANDERLERRA